VETVALIDSQYRVLAEDISADRDYPPFNRSARDGFAVRAADLPGRLRVIGEVPAGQMFSGEVSAGEAVEIMTGAPVPSGADAVVMVEHTVREGDHVAIDRAIDPGSNVVPRGSEAGDGVVVLTRGKRVGYAEIALLATVGCQLVKVFAQPRVAILATGDEIVEDGATPKPWQIRNSNAWSLAAQIRRAGGTPVVLPIARDVKEETARLISRGLAEADLLLLSGGVSAGKYDVVEPAFADLGAEIFFERVAIQPGQPLVFGRARDKFFFGLPGNPLSTMVTFELFARAAIDLLCGASDASLPVSLARLTRDFRHKAGLTRFLPAWVEEGKVTPVPWQGSGDVVALSRANAFLIADPEKPEYEKDIMISILLK
jgi:molybdopterin molybdotransferase